VENAPLNLDREYLSLQGICKSNEINETNALNLQATSLRCDVATKPGTEPLTAVGKSGKLSL
jgi:hypothetical protein